MVGNVGREPELRRLSDGATVCNFNLAVNETSRDKKGAVTSSPTWFRVTVWGERAVICARSLKKEAPFTLPEDSNQNSGKTKLASDALVWK